MEEALSGVLLAVFIIGGMILYALPSFLADKYKHPQTTPICLINILLGWTFIIWVLCLAWACASTNQNQQVKENG